MYGGNIVVKYEISEDSNNIYNFIIIDNVFRFYKHHQV